MDIHQIYVIFARDAVYIGRSKRLIERMRNHGMLWCDWAVLENVPVGVNSRGREFYWVKHFLDLGVNVLNEDKICRDGNLGHSEETRRKIGDAQRGSKNHMFGKRHTEEWKKANSELMKGNKHATNSPGRVFTKEEQIKGGQAAWAMNLPKLLAAATSETCAKAGRISQERRRQAREAASDR